MTDALSSLYPVNQIGADGFNWWIGQVESTNADDNKGGDRWKVRIVGLHPKTCNDVPTEDLPWARVVMPVHAPHLVGGATSVSTQLEPGAWVVGFFLDTEKQQPAILGSIGRDPNSHFSDYIEQQDPTPGLSGCKSFITFLDEKNKIIYDVDPDDENKPTVIESGSGSDGIKRDNSSGVDNGVRSIHSDNSQTNSAGIKFCVDVADPCGKESDLGKTFTNLFAEMLYEIQNNDGKLGNYLVGELTGGLQDHTAIGRKYVNKAIKVIRTFVAKIKGFVLEKIKEAVDWLTNALLRPTELGNALKPVMDFFNKHLDMVGCTMEDLADRLVSFISDLIFGYLFNIYKQTACQVDSFVNGIIKKIQSLMTGLLGDILGPLQDILGMVASPLNMIGDAINYVLNLLGISCGGPNKDCAKNTRVCTHGKKPSEREDFLDRLLTSLEEDGPLADVEADWSQYTCDDVWDGTKLDDNGVVFVGGIQEEDTSTNIIKYNISDVVVKEGEKAYFKVKRSGKTDVSSSVRYSTRDGSARAGIDYEKVEGILGFSPGVTEKSIDVRTYLDYNKEGNEDFFVRIDKDTPTSVSSISDRTVARCTIKETVTSTGDELGSPDFLGDGDTLNNPFFTSIDPANESFYSDADVPENDETVEQPDTENVITNEFIQTYTVDADKTSVKEGDFITYTITTSNVPSGSRYQYSLFGNNITGSDFITGNTQGYFVIEDNTAIVVVGIVEDAEFESSETLIFSIPGTGASVSVLILGDDNTFSEEEKLKEESKDTSDIVPGKLKVPSAGEIITTPNGEIISIPVDTPGSPYRELPFVLITGNGYNGSGIPLADDNGRITEIRITDPGYGYKVNTPSKVKKECIIDSFTMISPGRGYTETPTIYVDGDPTVAEALIESGKVISIRIKNRELTFDTYPKVLIKGGGGIGAKFLPSFSCLSPPDRVRVGSAKIGTGSYIDCP